MRGQQKDVCDTCPDVDECLGPRHGYLNQRWHELLANRANVVFHPFEDSPCVEMTAGVQHCSKRVSTADCRHIDQPFYGCRRAWVAIATEFPIAVVTPCVQHAFLVEPCPMA